MNTCHPTPPDGYVSWLDFAVETFDTRGLWVERLFTAEEDTVMIDREAVREAARAELRELRAAAARAK